MQIWEEKKGMRRALGGKQGAIRVEPGSSSSSRPPLSLTLVLPEDVEHVDGEALRFIVFTLRLPEALVLVVPVLVVVRVPVLLVLRLGAGLPVLLVVLLSGSLLLRRPPLQSDDLRQVWVVLPVVCRARIKPTITK